VHCAGSSLAQDKDVLDTWFSSALWPFSVFGWPDRTDELAKWYPTSVLVTGFDIIFFWVARMIFSGVHHMGAPPFKDVCIHGLLRDEHGKKMSKTKGNVIDPLVAIDQYGCDAFRFTLAQVTVQGRDPHWNPKLPEANARFVNKIWQAFRFASMNLEDYDAQAGAQADPSIYDRWILARTGTAVSRVREALDTYRFNEAATEIHAFIWGEFCDWYLELSKPAMWSEGPAKAAAQHTLVTVLAAIARLIHPVMPFISEEIWQRLPATIRGGVETVMKAPYPSQAEFSADPKILEEVAFLQQAIVGLRKLKSDMELSPKVPLALWVRGSQTQTLISHLDGLRHMVKVTSIAPCLERPPESATIPVPGAEIFVPLAGLVDLDAERSRLDSELKKVDKDLADLTKRLGNPGFVDRAPAHVVQKFRDKQVQAIDRREQLAAARTALS
jgi:valyl-tRNA synthetase